MHLVQADGRAEERCLMVLVNGVYLLYGAVRDHVMTITSYWVHGPFLLPSGVVLFAPDGRYFGFRLLSNARVLMWCWPTRHLAR